MKKVGGARHKMEEDILKAKNYPNNSLILQLDGMDNQKSYCPRLLDKGKKLQECFVFRQKLFVELFIVDIILRKEKLLCLAPFPNVC